MGGARRIIANGASGSGGEVQVEWQRGEGGMHGLVPLHANGSGRAGGVGNPVARLRPAGKGEAAVRSGYEGNVGVVGIRAVESVDRYAGAGRCSQGVVDGRKGSGGALYPGDGYVGVFGVRDRDSGTGP